MEVREGFVEAEGHRLAYLAVNEHLAGEDEPAIVFIHGVLGSVNFWLDCVPPAFKADRAWYSLSLPAHHPSTVPADFSQDQINPDWFFRVMNNALDAMLGGRKAIVVGHSTGGFSALNLALNQAPNVIGIVSVGGFHKGDWGGVEGQLLKLAGWGNWARSLFVANILVSKKSPLVRSVFVSLLAHDSRALRASPLGKRLLENMQVDAVRQDPDALFALFRGIRTLEIKDQLHRIRMPCYIFSGTHDPVIPEEQSAVLARRIPNAREVAFHKVGHMPFIECPHEYFQALEQALETINAETTLSTENTGQNQ